MYIRILDKSRHNTITAKREKRTLSNIKGQFNKKMSLQFMYMHLSRVSGYLKVM